MSIFIGFLWFFVGVLVLLLVAYFVISIVGAFMHGDNEAKAARYLADKYDRERK